MKKKILSLLITIAAFGAALGITFLAKDSIVWYLGGLPMFRAILIGVTGVGAVAVGANVVSSVVTVSKIQDQLENSRQEQLAIEEAHRRQTARLSMDGKLDNAALRRILSQKGQDGWSIFATEIESCVGQLTTMDDYQERLAKLLESNGADTLSDTEDVLDQAEQGLCRNVRKVINYMEVANSSLPEDTGMIRTKLEACLSQNSEILKQSQEFVFALTEYLNRQGDDGGDLSMLEIYKKTILESIGENK